MMCALWAFASSTTTTTTAPMTTPRADTETSPSAVEAVIAVLSAIILIGLLIVMRKWCAPNARLAHVFHQQNRRAPGEQAPLMGS